ncbi:MAG: class I SAM-dependent methyltransferase, partial [Verrucomicrobiota bacterium]
MTPTSRASSTPARPTAPPRAAYAPSWPPETFIVPLLARRIDELITQCARGAAPESRALDVGCGRQPFRAKLESLGYSYHSVDVAQNPEGTVEFIAPIDGVLPATLELAAGFDFILCTEVLEHVADWPTAFRNLARLLAPGGT